MLRSLARSSSALPPDGVGADDTHNALRSRPKSKLGGGKQPVDDVSRPPHAIVDERRFAVRPDNKEGRRLALAEAVGELDIDLGTVVKHTNGLPRGVAFKAIAKP